MSALEANEIAVAVPVFRAARYLPGLIESLRELDPAPGVLLAVDDGSGDRSGDLLRESGFDLSVHPENLGLGFGRNTLWRRAEELGMKAVAYLDADVRPPGDYLGRVLRLLGEGEPSGVGGRNRELEPAGWVDEWRGRFWAQDLGEVSLLDAPMLVGACATYRIDALREVEGFEPTFRTHGEDVDIGRRLRAEGHRLRYEPSLEVAHVRVDSPLQLVRSCYAHCREGMRATLETPGESSEPTELVMGMSRKFLRAPAAALLRRGDPREAALGLAACGAGLLGYVAGWTRPR